MKYKIKLFARTCGLTWEIEHENTKQIKRFYRK